MQLRVANGKVIMDAERERALRDFAGGTELPPPQQRDIETMLVWLDAAISTIDPCGEREASRYAGLVLDKQYLRLVQRGLSNES